MAQAKQKVSSKKRILRRMFIIVATTYFGVCLLMYFFQRSLLYHPTFVPQSRRGSLETFQVDGASLKVSVQPRDSRNAVLYFGGNGEDVSASLSTFALAFPKHAIYMVHYRGYGGSSGAPSEDAIHGDAQAMLDIVKVKHPQVVVVGRSLGSGVAVRLAASNSVERVVLVTPYDSILNVAKSRFPFVPVSLMLHDKFESWRFAPKVKAPVLILAAENDKRVLPSSTKILLESFSPGIANLIILKGTGHNSIARDPSYMAAMTLGN